MAHRQLYTKTCRSCPGVKISWDDTNHYFVDFGTWKRHSCGDNYNKGPTKQGDTLEDRVSTLEQQVKQLLEQRHENG